MIYRIVEKSLIWLSGDISLVRRMPVTFYKRDSFNHGFSQNSLGVGLNDTWYIFAATSVFSNDGLTGQIFPMASENSILV